MDSQLFAQPSGFRAKHTIQFYGGTDDVRTSWECSCGSAGSAPTYRVEEAAEKHIPDGAQVAYRYPGNDWKWR